jgi:epsilon-lactone hydrolase
MSDDNMKLRMAFGAAIGIGAVFLATSFYQQNIRPTLDNGQMQTYQATGKVTWGPDGTLLLPAHSFPMSSMISNKMKQAYVQQLGNLQGWPAPPGYDQPIEVWEAYWKVFDEKIMMRQYTRWRELYPVDVESKIIGGVHTDIVVPKDGIAPVNENRVLMNLHGGGFNTGAGMGGLVESIPIAGGMKIKVISVDYRQGPLHKYPAASEDVAAVYQELLQDYTPGNIGIYGCSAGGRLTAQSVAWFQTLGLPNPGAIGVFCSGAGGGRGDTSPWGAAGLYSPPRTEPRAPSAEGYMGGVDPLDPIAAPATALDVLAKFPPTLLVSGTRSGDLSPSAYLHTQLLKVGVDAEIYVGEGGWHGFSFAQPDMPEATDANAYIAKWFDKHLGD